MSKVLAIGNALVDILVKINNDQLLDEFGLVKGSMQLTDMTIGEKILQLTGELGLENYQASGGSAANTIHGLAHLGIQTGFIGKVGDDDIGDFFQKDMEIKNIATILSLSNTASGRAITLVSPDSERTFATYLGAAVELTANDLTKKLFEGYDYFHVEGYLVQNHELLDKALSFAKDNDLKISIDLASFNVVEDNLDYLNKIVEQYVDIVFANEEEARAFTGKNPEEALEVIAEKCEIAVVKVGKDGSFIKYQGQKENIESINVTPLDTTGAGDLYAAGFLYGLSKGLSMNQCGRIGALLGGKVIETIGAKMDEKTWESIKEEIEECNS
jgi:sugar/nucleoside kinase (ribokinase family)